VFQRKLRVWAVKLQSAAGEVIDVEFKSYWSPSYEGIKAIVGEAAAAKAFLESGKQIEYAPVSVEELPA
jgi:hypothetical protein